VLEWGFNLSGAPDDRAAEERPAAELSHPILAELDCDGVAGRARRKADWSEDSTVRTVEVKRTPALMKEFGIKAE
jgi:hypothetical protein